MGDLPVFKMSMNGKDGNAIEIELPGAAYTWEYTVGNQNCYLMVQPWDKFVFGNIFLTNFVTSIDYGNF